MQPTNIANPAYFHKVVDCQWACPAHTPVPEYIRLIGQGRYSDAYMVNWASNVFPGILGRTCDRPCEPACRRSRVEEGDGDDKALPEPVAICRLKRVAADMKSDVSKRMPKLLPRNGKRIACIGAGPASLGGTDVKVIVRSGFDEMKASPWEKEDAQHEGIPILNFHVPCAPVAGTTPFRQPSFRPVTS